MKKRFIKDLATISFKDTDIQEETVERIVTHLNKAELKEYIKQLKNIIKSHTITVEVPRSDSAFEQQLQDAFPEKNIEIQVNPSLLLGMRVQDNDDIYELSLKNTLTSMSKYVSESL